MIRFVVFVVLFATVVYLVVRRLDRRGSGRATWGPAVRRQQQHRQRKTVAPDDDEDFLRGLDKRHREGTED